MATPLSEEQRARTLDLGECICPDQGHAEGGDWITFRETLDYQTVRAIRYAGAISREEDPDSSIATLMAVMNEGFILHGIESWTLREGRKPIEVEKSAIRQHVLANMEIALVVGDFADGIYQPQVLHPLLGLARRSSQPSPMSGSTSAPTASESNGQAKTAGSSNGSSTRSAPRPKRSRRSSTTSTPTVSIDATSSAPDGAFTS